MGPHLVVAEVERNRVAAVDDAETARNLEEHLEPVDAAARVERQDALDLVALERALSLEVEAHVDGGPPCQEQCDRGDERERQRDDDELLQAQCERGDEGGRRKGDVRNELRPERPRHTGRAATSSAAGVGTV